MISYLQKQGVALEDPDWGMQDESIPYSHEQVTLSLNPTLTLTLI